LGVGFGVAVAVGAGLGVGNWISLFVAVTRGVSFSASSVFCSPGSGEGKSFAGGGSPVVGSVAALAPPTLPNQTMLCAFEEILASTLQRINPAMSTTCASAISVTFRQKRAFFDIVYFASAFVAMPTFVICARCNVSIKLTSFCTGSSRSGRITIATSGFVSFNASNRLVSVSGSTI